MTHQLDIFAAAPPPRQRAKYGASPQWQRVLDYLERHGSITQQEAKDSLGCARLAARILDLKRMGYRITAQMVEVPARWTRTATVARYYYEGRGDV